MENNIEKKRAKRAARVDKVLSESERSEQEVFNIKVANEVNYLNQYLKEREEGRLLSMRKDKGLSLRAIEERIKEKERLAGKRGCGIG